MTVLLYTFYLAGLLVALGGWIYAEWRLAHPPVIPVPVIPPPASAQVVTLMVPRDDLLATAIRLSQQAFAPGTSGEYKRHAVLSALMKAYPARPVRDMAVAIEAALREG